MKVAQLMLVSPEDQAVWVPVLGEDGRPLSPMRNGDTLELTTTANGGVVGRIIPPSGPLARLWRRFAVWTLRL